MGYASFFEVIQERLEAGRRDLADCERLLGQDGTSYSSNDRDLLSARLRKIIEYCGAVSKVARELEDALTDPLSGNALETARLRKECQSLEATVTDLRAENDRIGDEWALADSRYRELKKKVSNEKRNAEQSRKAVSRSLPKKPKR